MERVMNIGITKENATKISQGLASTLADTYTLYLKTQNFHWNVTGPRFHQLHIIFEEQYKEMSEAIDEIAERIRALGHKSPGTFKEFLQLTSISEETEAMSEDSMITKLVEGHETISRKAREVVQIASSFKDEASSDLLSSRIKIHEKTAWMLRSFLQ
jgi:starvation-inducible DNA-binding protein